MQEGDESDIIISRTCEGYYSQRVQLRGSLVETRVNVQGQPKVDAR